jgi:predicted LPLAT superfamily acyltransferase
MEFKRMRGVESTRERPGAAFLGLCLRLAGPLVCYLCAPFVVAAYFLSGRRERGALIEFHRRLGAGVWAPWHAYLNFLRFAHSMIDRLFVARGGRLPSSRLECAYDVGRYEKGAVFLGAHFGDWTLSGQVFAARTGAGQGIHVVIDLGANPAFAAQVRHLAGRGARVIDASEGGMGVLLDVKRALDAGDVVCFLADRGPVDERLSRCSFLGAPANWHLGPFEIAARLGKPIVGFFSVKQGWSPRAPMGIRLVELWDGRDRPAPPAQALLERYVAALEREVQRAPTHWFNFFPFWANVEGNGRNGP